MPLHNLPPDLLHKILSHLPPPTLSTTSLVSRTFHTHSTDETLWRKFTSAPPGLAYKTHLLNHAWQSGRALRHTLHPPHSPASPLAHSTTLYLTTHTPASTPRLTILPSLHQLSPESGYGEPTCSRIRLIRNVIHVIFGTRTGHVLVYKLEDGTPVRTTCVNVGHRINSVDILGTTTPTAVAALSSGELAYVTTTTTLVSVSTSPLCSVSVSDDKIAAGTFDGAVYVLTLNQLEPRMYIGPCSCAVSTVSFADGRLLAGFAHRVAGNGHRAPVVAWDVESGVRLAAFGAVARSSTAVPVVASEVVGGNGRVGVVVGESVSVYGSDWRCLMRVEGRGLWMDAKRVWVTGEASVDVYDFEAALGKMPDEVRRWRT